MAKNYKITHMGVGPWKKGDVVSEQNIHDLQGEIPDEKDTTRAARYKSEVQRLINLGAVEETDDDVSIGGFGVEPPEHTKGDNVDPGSDDDVHKRAKRREEAVGKGNTGMPGPGAGATGEDLNDLTVADLHERAKAAGVEGYSTLHKDDLVKAVRKAEKKG